MIFDAQPNNSRMFFDFGDNESRSDAEKRDVTPEEEILQNQEKITTAFLSIRELIFQVVAERGQKIDPKGMHAYLFDSDEVSAKDALDIDINSPQDLRVEVEIDFNSMQTLNTSRSISFPGETPEPYTQGQTHEPESIRFRVDLGFQAFTMRIDLLPIGVAKPEWTQCSVEVLGKGSPIPLHYPEVLTDSQKGEVVVNGVRPRDAEAALADANGFFREAAMVADKIMNKKYHYRIFSSTSRGAEGSTDPIIIVNNENDQVNNPASS